jgi:hypothetical protein
MSLGRSCGGRRGLATGRGRSLSGGLRSSSMLLGSVVVRRCATRAAGHSEREGNECQEDGAYFSRFIGPILP